MFTSEPIVKISPPTPLKKQTHAVSNAAETQKKEQRVLVAVGNTSAIKSTDVKIPCEDSKFHHLSPNNSITSHNKSHNERIYSKETCPHHRHKTAIKIFDDNIEKYLRDDPRIALPERKDQLPQLRDAFKYNQVKSEVTSAKKIKRVIFPRRKHRPDDVIDLIANKITKVESKDKQTDTAERDRRNVRSDVLTSDLELFAGKKSTRKETNLAKDAKMKSALPKLVQPPNRAKSELSKLITRSPKSQKLSLHVFEIRDERVDNSE